MQGCRRFEKQKVPVNSFMQLVVPIWIPMSSFKQRHWKLDWNKQRHWKTRKRNKWELLLSRNMPGIFCHVKGTSRFRINVTTSRTPRSSLNGKDWKLRRIRQKRRHHGSSSHAKPPPPPTVPWSDAEEATLQDLKEVSVPSEDAELGVAAKQMAHGVANLIQHLDELSRHNLLQSLASFETASPTVGPWHHSHVFCVQLFLILVQKTTAHLPWSVWFWSCRC